MFRISVFIFCLISLFLPFGDSLSARPSASKYQKRQALEDEEAAQLTRQLKRYYKRFEGKGIVEITDEMRKDKSFPYSRKRAQHTDRRFFIFEYPSDGLMVKGYLSIAPECEKQPLLVFLRGGNCYLGLMHPGWGYSYFGNYTVIAPLYRGAANEGVDEYGGADVNDVKNLIDYIPTLEKKLGITISKQKKYILGASRGGMQMILALTRFPELQSYFEKGVSLSGLLDIEEQMRNRWCMRMMYTHSFGYNGMEWIKKRSPIYQVDKISKDFPVLIMQGSEDDRVSTSEGYEMLHRLKERGCQVDHLEVEGGDHCLENVHDTFAYIQRWFEKESQPVNG